MLSGKAQEAYSALTIDDSKVYEMVKAAVLKAYELVPEAYRQRFRSWEKSGKQTHMEFARDLKIHFNRRCNSLSVESYGDLCELIVLEQFKNTVPSQIAMYLNERKVKTATEAAALADEYVLTHRGYSEYRAPDDTGSRGDERNFRTAGKRWQEASNPRSYKPESSPRSQLQFDPNTVCNYCKGRGHWKAECPVKSGAKGGSGCGHVRPVALTAPVRTLSPRGVNSDCAILCCVDAPCEQVKPSGEHTQVKSDYSAFMSDGQVSLVGSNVKVPVKILRDTGAFDSYILSSVLPFCQHTDTGDCILMQGMGLTVLPVPVHKLALDCDLVRREVAMGVRPALPIPGVDIILGNDLCGSRVWASCPPSPVATSSPVTTESDESAQCFPDVFTACAVTRARCHEKAEPEVEQSMTEGTGTCSVSMPDSLLSVSHTVLATEQRADPSLSKLFDKVLSDADMKSAAIGYLCQDQLLVRKWVPHGLNRVGDPVFQVVVCRVLLS